MSEVEADPVQSDTGYRITLPLNTEDPCNICCEAGTIAHAVKVPDTGAPEGSRTIEACFAIDEGCGCSAESGTCSVEGPSVGPRFQPSNLGPGGITWDVTGNLFIPLGAPSSGNLTSPGVHSRFALAFLPGFRGFLSGCDRRFRFRAHVLRVPTPVGLTVAAA
jgi:hypothetical protein